MKDILHEIRRRAFRQIAVTGLSEYSVKKYYIFFSLEITATASQVFVSDAGLPDTTKDSALSTYKIQTNLYVLYIRVTYLYKR